MAHKYEHVSTGNGFSVQNGSIKTTVITQAGALSSVSGSLNGVTGSVSNITGTSAATMKLSTATATLAGVALSAGSQFVTVTSTDANHIVILPAPVVGTEIWLQNGATGYELRTSAPATIAINGGKEANAESAIGASVLVRAICTSATTWIASQFAADGTESKVDAAAAA